jgi:ectoine hydroxylase-related dioxygenase (phytanoyl-CoA dioxygenase family)
MVGAPDTQNRLSNSFSEAPSAELPQLTNSDFWHSFAPHLHIADPAFFKDIAPIAVSPEQRRAATELLRVEGYFQGTADWGLDLNKMATTVRALTAANLSAAFALLYDEFWIPFTKLHLLYSDLIGAQYQMLPDFWVWNVDPNKGEAGWKPHRDKGRNALLPDGSPKSLTTWIPISGATPLNSCMYIVPASLDPTYGTETEDQWKFQYPSIRALPGVPGDFFMWNQAVVHWGSQSSPRAPESRVSMAFEFQRGDVPAFNKPLLPPLANFPFRGRLKLIAKQILQYSHMYAVNPNVERMALEVLTGTRPSSSR